MNESVVGPARSCPRCQGSGWVCGLHSDKPRRHFSDGSICDEPGMPCQAPGCPFRPRPTDAEATRHSTTRGYAPE